MNYKNFLAATVLLMSTLGIQGCTDAQVGASIGAVVGGVIGGELGEDGNHRRERGDFERPRDNRRERCDRYRCYDRVVDLNLQVGDEVGAVNAVELVSDKYQISPEAATIIVSALAKAQTGDLSGLNELGFATTDFAAIYQNENPSTHTLLTMSEKLNMDVGDTNNLIQSMKLDIQAERARLQLN